MITSPLLSNVRYRAMITPVSSLHTKAVKPGGGKVIWYTFDIFGCH